MTAQELKNSILQLAVQGKLVPQDPNDEPASVLLERIRAEKEKLIKEKKIKKEKNPSTIFRGADNIPYEKVGDEVRSLEDEIPFEIPDSWEWTRLSSANDMYTGNSINETEKRLKYTGLDSGRFYIGTKDVGFDHEINYDNGVRIPLENDNFRVAPSGSILLCIEGGSAGRKIAFTNQTVCFGNKLCCFVSFGLNPMFLYYYLQSPLFLSAFKENTTGIIGGVSVNTLKEMFLPIPPLAEQQRIVDEIERIIPFIIEYDKAETNLRTLNTSFPEALKKSILQMAVQGKLVPQDHNDEPAEVLLERIRGEKERLVKEGKIKKDKNESVIFRRDNSHYEKLGENEVCIDDELPSELPLSWVWVRLSNLVYNHGQKTPDNDFCYIDIGSINNKEQKLNADEQLLAKEKAPSRARKVIEKGDIIYSTVRPYLHNIAIIDRDFSHEAIASTGFAVLCCYEMIYNKYLFYCLLSPQFDSYANNTENAKGVAYPAINDDRFYRAYIPLPPLAEQHRIVEKLEEILPKLKSL